jgi:hypothetical protein
VDLLIFKKSRYLRYTESSKTAELLVQPKTSVQLVPCYQDPGIKSTSSSMSSSGVFEKIIGEDPLYIVSGGAKLPGCLGRSSQLYSRAADVIYHRYVLTLRRISSFVYGPGVLIPRMEL